MLAGLNWNHRKFYIPISFHRRRRAKLIDLIKLWTRPWLKLLCYLFCFVSVASLNWRWWVSLSSLLFLLSIVTDWCGNWFCFNNKSFTLSFYHRLPPLCLSCCYPYNTKNEILSVVLICRIINQKMKSSSLFSFLL